MISKIIFILLLLFILNQTLISQDKGLGFKGGITLSNFTSIKSPITDSEFPIDSKISFNAGVFIDVFKKENLVVSSGLYFNRKAGLVDVSIIGIPIYGGVDFTIDYLEYGIPLKYNFTKSNFIPYIFLEPRVSFYLGSNFSNDKDSIPQYYQTTVKEDLTKFGAGLSTGIGSEIKLDKKISILFEAQFSPDFFYTYSTDFIKTKSNSLEFRIGLKFY
ncbi:MAG: PorT family protein [Bacteroidota bacterium]|nr:PorT family protein [Bacteroidota bacterium]